MIDKFNSLTNNYNQKHNIRTEALANVQMLEGIKGFPEEQINILKDQIASFSKDMSKGSIGWSNKSVQGVVDRTNTEIAKNGNLYDITPEINPSGFKKYDLFDGSKSYVETLLGKNEEGDTEERRARASDLMTRQNQEAVRAREERERDRENSISYSGGSSSYGQEGAGDGVREDRGVSGGISGENLEERGGGDRGMYKGGLMKKKKKNTKK